MLSNQQRNRNVTNDTAVQSVFVMLQHFYPELSHYMQLLEDKRSKISFSMKSYYWCRLVGHYENLQDKLNQLKDAREALNALRSEHYERKQQEAMERDRQRQIQLAQKLEFMRQKKQVKKFEIFLCFSSLLVGIFGISTSNASSTSSSTRIRNEKSSRTTTTISIGTRTIRAKSSISKCESSINIIRLLCSSFLFLHFLFKGFNAHEKIFIYFFL